MKLVRSDSPEVTQSIASTGVLACWGWSVPLLVCIASAPGLFIGIVTGLIVSVRLGIWLGVPIVIALNIYLFWRGRTPGLNWVIAGCADRLFIRLFMRRKTRGADVHEPEVMILDASEIASMFVKTVEVFVYGPKPKVKEWLVVEPIASITKQFSDQVSTLQCRMSPNACGIEPINPDKQVFVGNDEGPLTIEWQWCRPDLRLFLRQVARECPSIVIASEERSELDLNGIWRQGPRGGPDKEQRRMLVRATRLGFGSELPKLLWLYRNVPHGQTRPYLAEIVREEAGTEHFAVETGCHTHSLGD